MTIGTEPLRAGTFKRGKEFARGWIVNQTLFLVLHEALRQRLGVGCTILRCNLIVRSLLFGTARETANVDGIDRLINHLTRGTEGYRPIRIAFSRGKTVA